MSKQHDSSFAYWIYVFVVLLGVQFSTPTTADEAGVSFWLPGQYGSFAAVPSTPGWSFESTYYMPQPKPVAALVLNGAVEFKTA
jgi:hypothetical protein